MLLLPKPYFVVYYKPRTSQFIVGLNKYLDAVNHEFAADMRFQMRFEGEDSPERRFTGNIVGIEGLSSHWENSKWRSLKVQWYEPASIARPERVSPWEIEPFLPSAISHTHAVQASLCRVSSIGIPIDFCVSPKLRRNCRRGCHVARARGLAEKAVTPPASISNGGIDEHGPSTMSGAFSDQKSDLSKVSKRTETRAIAVTEIKFIWWVYKITEKVQMQGIAVGRAVDLTSLRWYAELIDELEEMFEIKGELRHRDKWEIVFTDDEGDMMLVGDDPWP
ncbi:auxin response factor 18 [Actinidia rufa]|uniref:Auxin-responsive protein n=1 Tax=Actinidia rufa TaxID=165716 RepID=A0A7J0FS49_9ERIC|nr:auxin response factor 18 [Actinidia rufa]